MRHFGKLNFKSIKYLEQYLTLLLRMLVFSLIKYKYLRIHVCKDSFFWISGIPAGSLSQTINQVLFVKGHIGFWHVLNFNYFTLCWPSFTAFSASTNSSEWICSHLKSLFVFQSVFVLCVSWLLFPTHLLLLFFPHFTKCFFFLPFLFRGVFQLVWVTSCLSLIWACAFI